MHRLVWLALLAACPGPQTPSAKHNPLVDAAGNPGKLRKLMRGVVMNAGLWFDDAACQQFSEAAEIHEDRMDDFARCLAKLQLQESMRSDPLPDALVMTYPPGLEIEARIVDEEAGPRLTWIGYESRRERQNGLPSVSPETLEALRVAGTRDGPLAQEISTELGKAFVWLDVCIGANGDVTDAHPLQCSSRKAALAFRDAAEHWKFQPFAIHGQPLAVCSLVMLSNRPDDDARKSLPDPDPDQVATEAAIVAPKELTLVSGDKTIEPDPGAMTAFQQAGGGRLVGVFKVCVDTSGHVERVRVLRSTRLRSYDEKIGRTIKAWVFAPYVEDGNALHVCTAFTFIYSQT